ncbi:WhiB family transcriptional regulator [Citricoccus nitrophenolicus]|uniref:WhiB family transcriptional regulator n=1 Tax=Citricoccus nitrophenolicus TaxID=863575 RepID=A0ABV0IE59_9MICC
MDHETDHATVTPCQMDPETWFPEMGVRADMAKRLCLTQCPALDACRRVARDFEGDEGRFNRHGIWGGMTPTERADEAAQRVGRAA